MTDTFRIAVAQLNPIVGDIDGNLAKARAARAEAAGPAPICSSSPSSSSPAIRPRTSSSSRPSRTPAGRPSRSSPGYRRRRAGRRRRLALAGRAARSTTPSRSSTAARIAGLRYKVELPNYGVFDEIPRLRRGPLPGPVGFRGVRLGVPICEDIWFDQVRGMPGRDRRRDADRRRTARPIRRTRRTSGCRSPSPASSRPACRSSMSTSSAARTSWSSTAAPSASMPTARSPSRCRSSRSGVALTTWQRDGRGLALRRRAESPRFPAIEEANWRACVSGLARLRQQERLSRRRARPFRRHRFGGVRGDGRRCARAGARPLRDAALSLHLEREPERCRGDRRDARRPLRHRADRRRRSKVSTAALAAALRRHASPTSPRRTCSRARAARC